MNGLTKNNLAGHFMYKSIDLFAGIGGIRLGFDKAFKDDISTVFVSEWDLKAQESYAANFHDPIKFMAISLKWQLAQFLSMIFCWLVFPAKLFP